MDFKVNTFSRFQFYLHKSLDIYDYSTQITSNFLIWNQSYTPYWKWQICCFHAPTSVFPVQMFWIYWQQFTSQVISHFMVAELFPLSNWKLEKFWFSCFSFRFSWPNVVNVLSNLSMFLTTVRRSDLIVAIILLRHPVLCEGHQCSMDTSLHFIYTWNKTD